MLNVSTSRAGLACVDDVGMSSLPVVAYKKP